MFREVRQNKIFQDVIAQVQEAIVQGKLKPGDKLPPERELKEMFNTSRGSLREALRVLEQKGLIAIKTGVNGGAIVKTLTTVQVSESLGLLIRFQKVSLKDLAEFREGIEGIVASLAAERAKKEDIQNLRHLLAELKICVEEGLSHWGTFIQVDNQFHLTLAHIARNPVFMSVLKTIHDNIHSYYSRFLPEEEGLMRKNYRDLSRILKAVEKRESAKAGLVARKHVKRFSGFMEKKERKERGKSVTG